MADAQPVGFLQPGVAIGAARKLVGKPGVERRPQQLREAEPGEVLLNQRRVFILPTGAGVVFAGLLLVLLIASTNYNLGLGFALTFMIATCAVVDMYFTYRNLVELHLLPGRAQPVFAGEDACFELTVVNHARRDRYALWIDFLQAGQARYVTDVMAGASASLLLSAPSSARGWLRAPRVKLATRFPLGLFGAWSYWQPDAKTLVYPFPEVGGPPLPMSGAASAINTQATISAPHRPASA